MRLLQTSRLREEINASFIEKNLTIVIDGGTIVVDPGKLPIILDAPLTPVPAIAVHSRNTARMVRHSRPSFDRAYASGLMGVSCAILPNRRIEHNKSGTTVIDYTRCGYLGLDEHPDVIHAARQILDEYPSIHFSVARTRLSIQPLIDLEYQLAELFDVGHVIAFPTVAAANMGALPLLAAGLFTNGEKPLIVVDRFAHVTLQYHIPVLKEETDVVIIAHNDMRHLEQLCQSGRTIAFVGDGAYSMGGTAPVSEIRQLQDRYGLFAYLDDAHGISVAGDRGAGFARSQMDGLGDRTIIAASLGKGYGSSGGFLMLGTSEQEAAVKRFAPTYGFSCAPNMPAVGAALASAKIHATDELGRRQERLRSNLRLFDELLPTEASGSPLPIRFIRIGLEERAIEVAEGLLGAGHYVSAVFFPTVARGQAGLRVALTSEHLPSDIQNLTHQIKAQEGRTAALALQ